MVAFFEMSVAGKLLANAMWLNARIASNAAVDFQAQTCVDVLVKRLLRFMMIPPGIYTHNFLVSSCNDGTNRFGP